jgi:hypothetical protein
MFQIVFMDPKISKEKQISSAHYIVHKMLSQSNFCKILRFVIGHVIKYNN